VTNIKLRFCANIIPLSRKANELEVTFGCFFNLDLGFVDDITDPSDRLDHTHLFILDFLT